MDFYINSILLVVCNNNKMEYTKNIKNEEYRNLSKQKLRDGDCSPWEFLQTISQTIGKIKTHDIYLSSDSENSEDEDDEIDPSENKCAVCLLPRTTTWVFMPCRHAHCCKECSERLEELGQPCPVCRSSIQSIFQIFN